ncbi:hypothetical protein U3A55_00825 [Salarchaeum sp. III]|uniref:hypothetical protein n=1 Tax=Salarchaeum sp. III TaxID=3107927 RepID=UPI002EDA52FD
MAELGTATISVLVALVTSVAANLLSWFVKRRSRKKEEARNAKKEWYSNIIHKCNQMKKVTLRINDTGNLEIENGRIDFDRESDELAEISLLLQEIEELSSQPPEGCRNGEVHKKIQSFSGRLRNPTSGKQRLETVVDLTEFTYGQAQEMKKLSEKKRKRVS